MKHCTLKLVFYENKWIWNEKKTVYKIIHFKEIRVKQISKIIKKKNNKFNRKKKQKSELYTHMN